MFTRILLLKWPSLKFNRNEICPILKTVDKVFDYLLGMTNNIVEIRMSLQSSQIN
jgi:hypothetical protein